MLSQNDEVVRFSHVSMQFPGVLANDDISLSIRKGEVFALVGENGAGKSTLMNLLYGMANPTLGEIYIGGVKTSAAHNPERAIAMGVGMVHQHFMLVPSFTVAQNIMLGREIKKHGLFCDTRAMNEAVTKLSKEYGLEVNPTDRVRELSMGLQQRVEILKVLYRGASILVLDEPTAVLTPQETDELFSVIRRVVSQRQMTVILITHRLPEVMAISDRVGVMQRGKLLGVMNTSETDERAIAAMMVGRDVIFDDLRSEKAPGEVMLELDGLSALDDRGLPALKGISLNVRAGEIVGVVGVEGNGQSQLAECIMGMRPQTGGKVLLHGENISRLSPREIREKGVTHIPEDRLKTGLSAKATVTDNLVAGRQREKRFAFLKTHLRQSAMRDYAKSLSETFDIRGAGVNSLISELSGGNMQKVVIAREFSFESPVLVISQPTRGVDIGAIEFIHEAIIEKRNQGCAILLISADLDELYRLSDRMVTIYDGQITGRFGAGEIDRAGIGLYMTGAKREEAGEC